MINVEIAGTEYPLPSGSSDTNWASMLVGAIQALAAAVSPLKWTAVAFASGWSGSLAYAKDSQGRVWLRGTATHSGSVVGTVTTLPSGYRTPATAGALCVDQTGGLSVTVALATNGDIVVASGANNSVIDFGQISYDTQAF